MNTTEITSKIKELRELQALIEEAQAEAETIKDTIKAQMGDCEELRAGEYKITWKPVESSRIDTAAQCLRLRKRSPRPQPRAASALHEKSPLPECRPKPQAKSFKNTRSGCK